MRSTGKPDSVIQVHRDSGVVTVVLNRPSRRNALRSQDFALLAEICHEIRDTTPDRVVVLSGAGDHFCAGADLEGLDPNLKAAEAVSVMRKIQAAALALHQIGKPVIAAVAGSAVGAGCNLALGADIVYASDTAKLGQVFIKRGLALDFGGSYLLPRRIGLAKAKLLAFTGATVDAADAERIGLVDAVFDRELLPRATQDLARDLASRPSVALSAIKAQLERGSTSTFGGAVEFETFTQTLCSGSGEMAEAMSARKP